MLAAGDRIFHASDDLIEIFNRCFLHSYNTCLIGGCQEPIYVPANSKFKYHQLCFREDFFASALHEIAHWCIAGEQRRQLEDFGYWYEPDGRNELQQEKFLSVEIKPQALEKIFSNAANFSFQVSLDNLTMLDMYEKSGLENIQVLDRKTQQADRFKAAVDEQAARYLSNGLPPRAQIFTQALKSFYWGNI